MFFIADKKLFKTENPYQHDTRTWHVFLDLKETIKHHDLKISDLTQKYNTDEKYYKDALGELVEDGFIVLKDSYQ
jgi:predicted transcriptional regulator